MWRQGTLAGVMVLGGCMSHEEGPSLVAVPDTPPSLRVEVGGGQTTFEEIREGGDVYLDYGSQGGWHIWTGVKVHDESVGEARMNVLSRFEDGVAVGEPTSVAARLDASNATRVHAGMRAFVSDRMRTIGRRVVLRVEVVASDGRHGEAEKIVVAR